VTTGRTAITTLTPSENDLTWDAGIYFTASLGDRVWFDQNTNGILDAGEPGITSVTVTLFDKGWRAGRRAGRDCDAVRRQRDPVTTTTTDANGGFQLTNLGPGSYTFTSPDQGSNDAVDSYIDPATALSSTITLVLGQNNLAIYAGIVTTPTGIAMASFTASRDGDQVVVRWMATAEINTWGFQVYRSADGTRANATRVTPQLTPGQGRGQGDASYRWTDSGAAAGVTTPTG
jgi:large repetitive protein